MFNRSSNNDSITRSEAKTYVDGLEQQLTTAEAAVRRELSNLGARVTTLEALAARMRASLPSEMERDITGTAVRRDLPRRTPGASLGVDYGAIAFGLSEIARKIAGVLGDTSEGDLKSEYEGAVQYFADVFAKADPAFDEAQFKRQAGV